MSDAEAEIALPKLTIEKLRRWDLFARFLEDGRICLTNNAAERALRGIALGRKSWLFRGSDRGGVRAAAMDTPIGNRQAQRCRSAGLGSSMFSAGSPGCRRAGSTNSLLNGHLLFARVTWMRLPCPP